MFTNSHMLLEKYLTSSLIGKMLVNQDTFTELVETIMIKQNSVEDLDIPSGNVK